MITNLLSSTQTSYVYNNKNEKPKNQRNVLLLNTPLSFSALNKAEKQSISCLRNAYRGFNEPIEDGFVFYDPHYRINGENIIRENQKQENLIIDRTIDPILTKTIKDFRNKINELPSFMEPLDLIKYTGEYVRKTFEKNYNYNAISNDYINTKQDWLLGETIQQGAGICRHKTLLFKILVDDILKPKYGFKSAFVLGIRKHPDRNSYFGHSWNLIKFKDKDGKSNFYLVDPQFGEYINLQNKLYEEGDLRANFAISKTLNNSTASNTNWEFPYCKRPVSYKNSNYKDLSLNGMDLSGIDLEGSKLLELSLIGVNLRGTSLKKCELFENRASRADLKGADLSGAVIHNRNEFPGADFRGANLENTSFNNYLAFSNFYKANMNNTQFGKKAILNNALIDAENYQKNPFIKENYYFKKYSELKQNERSYYEGNYSDYKEFVPHDLGKLIRKEQPC